jgi:hypothetical protein
MQPTSLLPQKKTWESPKMATMEIKFNSSVGGDDDTQGS